jgi:hypothetical protein
MTAYTLSKPYRPVLVHGSRVACMLLVIVFLALAAPVAPAAAQPQAPTCTYTIGRDVTIADARTNYAQVRPGDVVCIEHGNRGALKLRNFTGTAQQPIVFINTGGQVVLSGSLHISNSRYFRLTGTGVAGAACGSTGKRCGIKITHGSEPWALRISEKSVEFEVDHLEVAHPNWVGEHGIGIGANNKSNCADGSDNNYDYDGDGQIKGDLDDVVSHANFIQTNSVFHHNWVHDTGGEAYYVGPVRTVYADAGQGGAANCPVEPKEPLNPVLKGVRIYDSLVEDTGKDAVSVKGAIEDCVVHHNQVYRDTQALIQGSEQGGINMALNSKCDVYNNFVKDGLGRGIADKGRGGNKIYNNVIVNAGGGYTGVDGSGIQIGHSTPGATGLSIWNNTIINPHTAGISIARTASGFRVQNNLIVKPGTGYKPIYLKEGAQASVSHNLISQTFAEVHFTAPRTDDYSLAPDSPAVDAGVDLRADGIRTDYLGRPRPQGAGFDIGAYEYVP